MQRELVVRGRQRFVLEEVADVLAGAALRLARLLLGDDPLVVPQRRLLLPVELGRGEAEARGPFHLGEKRVETALGAVLLDERIEAGAFLRPCQENRASRERLDERRVRLLGDFGQSRREHGREETIDHLLPVDTDRSLLPGREERADLHARRRHFLVRHERVPGPWLIGDVVDWPCPRRGRRFQPREVRLDQALDRGLVEVAHRDDRHEIRPVPVGVELLQAIRREGLEDFRRADGQPIRVARTLEPDREHLVLHARASAAAHAPFLEHDPALLVDLDGIEGDGLRPVFEDEQRPIHRLRLVGGDRERVDRLVEARVGVDVGAEAHAERFEERDDLVLREVARAVEGHVLGKMRQPALIVVFEDRPRLDDEPKLGAFLGLLVGSHVVAQAIRQRPDRDLGIDRNGLAQGDRLRRVRRDLSVSDGKRRGCQAGHEQKHHLRDSAHRH